MQDSRTIRAANKRHTVFWPASIKSLITVNDFFITVATSFTIAMESNGFTVSSKQHVVKHLLEHLRVDPAKERRQHVIVLTQKL